MKILVACDKFKGSLSASEACEAVARGLKRARPEWELEIMPLTDGGDGFVTIVTNAAGGQTQQHLVTGPVGRPVTATMGLVFAADLPAVAREMLPVEGNGRLAVLEMAEAAGLRLVSPAARDPFQTTTAGLGELLRLAAETRPAAILIGLGGSATHDLALGALTALGLRCLSRSGAPLPPHPAAWEELERLEGNLAGDIPPLYLASDVTNPLLGETGAAATFAPQKGLKPEDFNRLEALTEKTARQLCRHFACPESLIDEPGSGAAGGLGFGLRAAFGATLLPGFSLVSRWLNLEEKLARADLVITGEGSFDRSSLHGKGPGSLVRLALTHGRRIAVLAGRIDLSPEERPEGCLLQALSRPEVPPEVCFSQAGNLLENEAAALGRDFSFEASR